MGAILFNGEEIKTLTPRDLPLLIHGGEGSGASFYTICLAAKWFLQGCQLVFLCGYPMAEEQFAQQVGLEYADASFFTKEKVDDFYACLSRAPLDMTIVVVKNVELFPEVLCAVTAIPNLIVSGDISSLAETRGLASIDFATRVYFSPLGNVSLSSVGKYEGLAVSREGMGIVKVE